MEERPVSFFLPQSDFVLHLSLNFRHFKDIIKPIAGTLQTSL